MADFIGESNILNGVMLEDRKVSFIGHEFECVDEGFGENVPVDIVVRPEDIYIMNKLDSAQFTGTVTTCIFKGVHYEMTVVTREGYEIMIQDYNSFPVGSEVGMLIKPYDIQVMKKERTANVFDGEMLSESRVRMLGVDFECLPCEGLSKGDKVRATVDFDKVELLDHQEDGVLDGEVHFILYKGNHYHLTIRSEFGDDIFVDTDDIWDKGDLVGISLPADAIKIERRDE